MVIRGKKYYYLDSVIAANHLKLTVILPHWCPIPFDIEVFLDQLDDLMEASYKNRSDIRELVQGVVSTYHPA